MLNLIKDTLHNIKTVRSFTGHTVTMLIALIISFSWAIGVFLTSGADDVRSLIANTIAEYGELDRTHLANLTDCVEVHIKEDAGTIVFTHVEKELVKQPFSEVQDEFALSWGYDVVYPLVGLMKVNSGDTSFLIHIPKALKLTLISISIMFFAFFIGGIILLNYYIKKVRKTDLMQFSTEKTGLQTLITSVLSENLHHEMKTPLCSIGCELNNVREVLDSIVFLPEEYCGGCGIVGIKDEVEQSFNTIEENIKCIYNVIETIKTSKNAKFGGDAKTLYDIAVGAGNIITSTSKVKNFQIKVDESLKNYTLSNFKTEDLINIFINHLKNSIEANATRIVFNSPVDIDENGFLTLFIVDNGNGIPDEAKSHIYDLHFSTKEENDDSLRGIGLFLSREILRTYAKVGKYHGDEWVYDTSKDGTTFGMRVPAIPSI